MLPFVLCVSLCLSCVHTLVGIPCVAKYLPGWSSLCFLFVWICLLLLRLIFYIFLERAVGLLVSSAGAQAAGQRSSPETLAVHSSSFFYKKVPTGASAWVGLVEAYFSLKWEMAILLSCLRNMNNEKGQTGCACYCFLFEKSVGTMSIHH
jgi:hypothetical protein